MANKLNTIEKLNKIEAAINDEEGEMVDSMGGFYGLTFEDADAYFDFEIAEIKQIN